MRELDDGVEITDGSGTTSTYDAVVIATHPAQALAMLEAPTPLQRELLAAMPYSPNVALLHTDVSLLPDAPAARASWNFHRPADTTGAVTVTYDLTRLQRLPTDTHYLVTLGGEHLVDPATVIDRMEYEHPLYTPASVAAMRRLPEINTDRIAFAGAYHGWGFHEDGARSGLAAATTCSCPGRAGHGSCRGRVGSRRRSATPVGRPSTARSSTPRRSGSSTSTTCPTTAPSPASRHATTSARPTGASVPTSRRCWPTTGCRWARVMPPARS